MVTAMGLRSDNAGASTVVVVEGLSDQLAIEGLAERRGVDLAAAGVTVVRLGGAHRIGNFLDQLGRTSDGLRLAGLCDAGEEPIFRRALERAGFGCHLTRARMEQLGFYVCVEDLEDELIRALGAPAVEEIVRANGDLRRFRTLQQMPAWRSRATEEQLRRFMGSGAGRKIRYARFLIDALDLESVPRPLDRVLVHAFDVAATEPDAAP
jgi:Overcoming lysogenization defect protein-like, TOPRIM domain